MINWQDFLIWNIAEINFLWKIFALLSALPLGPDCWATNCTLVSLHSNQAARNTQLNRQYLHQYLAMLTILQNSMQCLQYCKILCNVYNIAKYKNMSPFLAKIRILRCEPKKVFFGAVCWLCILSHSDVMVSQSVLAAWHIAQGGGCDEGLIAENLQPLPWEHCCFILPTLKSWKW